MQRLIFFVLLLLTVALLGYWTYMLTQTEEHVEKEIDTFEAPTPPKITLGYGGQTNYYTDQIEILPDIARLYDFEPPLEPDRVGLKGVWFVERDKITSLSEGSVISIRFRASKVGATFYGFSSLPIRIELDGAYFGEFKVEEPGYYPFINITGEASSHTMTLYVPRGISSSLLTFE